MFPLIVFFSGLLFGLNQKRALVAALCVASSVSILAFVWAFTVHPLVNFYMMPLRFWELAAGCLVALKVGDRSAVSGTMANTMSNAVVVSIGCLYLVPASHALTANIGIVVLTMGALAFVHEGAMIYRVLTVPVVGYLGRISYSLYLWHWPVLVLSRWTVGVHWWTIPFQVLLILVLADQSYRWVERPLRHAAWGRSPIRTVGLGLAFMASSAALVGVLVFFHGALYLGERAQLLGRGVSSLSEPYQIARTSYRWAGEPCVLSDNGEAGLALPLNDCTLGDFATAQRRVVVVGNSYSAAFVQSFDALVTQDDFAIMLTSSWGASPIRGLPNVGAWTVANDYYWNTAIPEVEDRLKPGDWVFLASDLNLLSPARQSSSSEVALAQYVSALRSYASELDERGVRLAVLAGLPLIREANCTPDAAVPQWFAPAGGPCKLYSKRETLRRLERLSAQLRGLEMEQVITVVDLMPVFCATEVCGYLGVDGELLYRDEFSHPSVEAARTAAPLIRQTLLGEDRQV